MTEEEIRMRLRVETVKYSLYQKLKAYTYHIYIFTLGPIFCREKYNNYKQVFNEFLESRKK